MISENQKVIKRDGTEVLYDDAKVRRAVARAVKAVDGEVSEEAQEDDRQDTDIDSHHGVPDAWLLPRFHRFRERDTLRTLSGAISHHII